MNPFTTASRTASTPVSRRSWMTLAVATLSGCGGGGGGAGGFTGLPGTGGTGVFAQGSISGFGSVIVNGIKFDDTAATVLVNGVATTSADLRLGMVANVQGTRGTDLTAGVASVIETWSCAQGLVSGVQSNQFIVAGMTIMVNSATVFEGLTGAAALSSGQRVAVWGLQSSADASSWTATRVMLVTATAVVSTGLVAVSGTQRTLHGLVLSGSAAAALTAGQSVRVQGTLVSGLGSTPASLQVDSIKVFDATSTVLPQGEAEIEGLVTATISATRFMLGTIEVDASSALFTVTGAAVTVGQRLEVEGSWQGRVLKAVKVEFEGELLLQDAEIDAKIEQYTSLANFVVRGQRCDGSNLKQIGNGKVSDLKVGVKVKVQGAINGNVLVLTSLEIDS